MTKNGWLNLVGTVFSSFRLGFTGVRIKDVSGVLQVRNSGDSADANLKASVLQLSGVGAAAGYLAQFDASGNVSAVAPGTAGAGVYPNAYFLIPRQFHVISGGFGAFGSDSARAFGGNWVMNGLNTKVSVTLPLAAGDYAVTIMLHKSSVGGDPYLSVDGGTAVGFSGYNATTLLNQEVVWSVTGLAAGMHTFVLSIPNKQPASSGYTLAVSFFTIEPNP